jgi:carbonic anhydrase
METITRKPAPVWRDPLAHPLHDLRYLLLPWLLCAATGHASLCDSGQRQSPINIRQVDVVSHTQPAMLAQWQDAPLTLSNDGHTLRVRFANSGQLILGKEHYRLQQFHFHTPGGEQIDGERFPFAAHILHKSAAGQLLAIVVPFRLGAEHPLLAQLLARIPPRADGDHHIPGLRLNARQLLPKDLGYYRYTGSLTAAPCTEGVQWLVMKQAQELSAGQLATWQAHFADNMRAVNPLQQRPVFATP